MHHIPQERGPDLRHDLSHQPSRRSVEPDWFALLFHYTIYIDSCQIKL